MTQHCCDNSHLLPVFTRFDSQTQHHACRWVEFVVDAHHYIESKDHLVINQ